MIPDDDFYYVLYQRRGLNDRKRSVWYFYFYDESHRKVRRSTGFTNKKKAVAFVNKLIASGRLRDSAVSSSKITFCDFAKPFWIWETCPYVTNVIKRGGHYSKDLCKSNRMCMEKHIIPTFGEVKLSRITKDMINDWLICLPDAHKISNKSANTMRLILYHMLCIAADKGLIRGELARKDNWVPPLPNNGKKRQSFTIEQYKLLFSSQWKNEYAKDACLLSATTGMRLGEIRALSAEQVHTSFIDVDCSWADGEGRKCTKGGKARKVPINQDTYTMLQTLITGSGLIFTLNGQTPAVDKFFTDPLKEKMLELGIDYKESETHTSLSFHSFRHFFNTRLVASGINAEIVRATIGHENEAMTENYLHLEVGDMTRINSVQNQLLELLLEP